MLKLDRFKTWPQLGHLILLLAGMLALLPEGPWWIAVFWLAALAGRALPCQLQIASQLLLLALAALAVTLAGGWLNGLALRLLVPLVVALKWAEARHTHGTRRDSALLLAGGLIVLALGARYRLDISGLFLVLLGVAGLLLQLQRSAPVPQRAAAVWQLLPALPLCALLFLVFPRIPGPLWEIGLSLGLPLAVSSGEQQGDLGVKNELHPGQPKEAGDGRSRPVLMARFEQYVPQTSRLYWRGPVLTQFDGQRWLAETQNRSEQMSQGTLRKADFLAQLPRRQQGIRYEARVSAHGERWLYSLDMPGKVVHESFISRDGQLLSLTRLNHEGRYHNEAWLDYQWKPQVSPAELDAHRQWPQHSNPQLAALGQSLQAQPMEQRVDAAIALLQKAGITYQTALPPYGGQAAFDHYWFKQRQADTPVLAGAFALLLRSAGLPTRVVSGFRGGRLVALTNVVLVKHEHAHAWVEVWQPAAGWVRFDPTDLLLAGQIGKPNAAQKALEAAAKPTMAAASRVAVQSEIKVVGISGFKLPFNPSEWLKRWVVHLDGQQQQALWQQARALGANSSWLLLALLLPVPLLLAWVYRHSRIYKRSSRIYREWAALEKQLAGLGLPRAAQQCISEWLAALPASLPDRAALLQLGERYLRWRFAGQSDDQLSRDLRRWRQQLG